jgi:hypothetical protein
MQRVNGQVEDVSRQQPEPAVNKGFDGWYFGSLSGSERRGLICVRFEVFEEMDPRTHLGGLVVSLLNDPVKDVVERSDRTGDFDDEHSEGTCALGFDKPRLNGTGPDMVEVNDAFKFALSFDTPRADQAGPDIGDVLAAFATLLGFNMPLSNDTGLEKGEDSRAFLLALGVNTPRANETGGDLDELGGGRAGAVDPTPLIIIVPSWIIGTGAELGNKWMLTLRQFGKPEWLDSGSRISGTLTGP